jgi:ribosomal protein L28
MSFNLKYPTIAHIGNRVSHAKNRSKHPFKYNLHTVTVVINGVKERMRVPSSILRKLKQAGVTTHYKKAE